MSAPLTAEERVNLRKLHGDMDGSGVCDECSWDVPCPTIRLLDDVDALRVALEAVPEWGNHFGDEADRCYSCQGMRPEHKPDCQRQLAPKGAPDAS